jgi:PTH1 family peptidyl-tRNA hydrolase
MLLIIGLGNPGEKYVGTRHNVGFDFLDKLKTEKDFPDFAFNQKFNSEISSQKETVLVKPQTFMNLSGEAVHSLLHFYKLTPDNILVVHDDKDIALGEYRLATDSSSAGHNGVQDIIDKLGTQKFKRIRVGVGTQTELPAEVFVLQKFSDLEKEKVDNVLEEVLEKMKNIA